MEFVPKKIHPLIGLLFLTKCKAFENIWQCMKLNPALDKPGCIPHNSLTEGIKR